MISQGLFLQLWMQNKPSSQRPILQLLNLQKGLKPNQLILRLSDRLTYLDCLFLPKHSCDITQRGMILRNDEYVNKFDLVRLDDFETKPLLGNMAGMTLLVKKITLEQRQRRKLGRPEQLMEFVENEGLAETQVKLEDGREGDPEWEQKPNMEKLYDTSLTIADLKNKMQGVLLCRVFKKKMKVQKRQNGNFSIMVFHIIDKTGATIKCQLMGGDALKNDKRIHDNGLYGLSGMELSFNSYINSYIVKFKDYQVNEIDSEWLNQRFARDRYNIFNENLLKINENQVVDLVGCVVEIGKEQEKAKKASGEKRMLSFLKVSTEGKIVNVSFWGENSDALHNMLIMEREPIILTDLGLRQGFLEYTSDSSIIRINQDRQILLRHPQFQQYLKYNPNRALLSLHSFKSLQDKSPTAECYAYICSIRQHGLCSVRCRDCDSRLKITDQMCPLCNNSNIAYRYSAYITLADSTDSLDCTAFDESAVTIFGVSAEKMCARIRENPGESILAGYVMDREFIVTLSYKKDMHRESRIILKSIQQLDSEAILKKTESSIKFIHQRLEK